MIRAYGQRLTRTAAPCPSARGCRSLIGEPWHPPAVGFSYAFDGTALDLDAHAVAGLLSRRTRPYPATFMINSCREPMCR